MSSSSSPFGVLSPRLSPRLTPHLEKALKAYQQANNDKSVKTAFLYRMKERDVITGKYIAEEQQKAKDYVQKFLKSLKETVAPYPEREARKKAIEAFFKIQSESDEEGIYYDMVEMEKIKEALLEDGSNLDEEAYSTLILQQTNATIESEGNKRTLFKLLVKIASTDYFGEQYDNLSQGGKLYCPPNEEHRWVFNLAWLLGHFHKGTDTFIIKSEVSEINSKRSSGMVGAGFYREIAVCYQLGYQFQQNQQGQIIMYHPNITSLKAKSLSDIDFDGKEIEESYKQAMEAYTIAKSHKPGQLDKKEMSEQPATFTPGYTAKHKEGILEALEPRSPKKSKPEDKDIQEGQELEKGGKKKKKKKKDKPKKK